jgi:hypothetical protein
VRKKASAITEHSSSASFGVLRWLHAVAALGFVRCGGGHEREEVARCPRLRGSAHTPPENVVTI